MDTGKVYSLAVNATTELQRTVFVTVKPAGGRGCEATYAADDPLSTDVMTTSNQGAQTLTRNVTASSTNGTYLLCAYAQESGNDAAPEATAFAQFLVGPDPCLTAKAALTSAGKALRNAEASVNRNRAAHKRYSRAVKRGSKRARPLKRRAYSRYRSAVRRRAKARATYASRQAAVTATCGA